MKTQEIREKLNSLNFEYLEELVTIFNNTFEDSFFIETVNNAGLEEEFTEATYETKEECVDYLMMLFETFNIYPKYLFE